MRFAILTLAAVAAVGFTAPAFAQDSGRGASVQAGDSVRALESGIVTVVTVVAVPVRLVAAGYGAVFHQIGEGSQAGYRDDPFRAPLKVSDEVAVRAQPAPTVPPRPVAEPR